MVFRIPGKQQLKALKISDIEQIDEEEDLGTVNKYDTTFQEYI